MYGAQRWNFKTQEYTPFLFPPDFTPTLYTEDMQKEIQCHACFSPLIYGDSYTSRIIHNHAGLGFPVCEDCYEEERQEELNVRS